MADGIGEVVAKGVHTRLDFHLTFNEGVNVLFGRNGSGKTTVLHVIANILNGDFDRFAFLQFREITLVTRTGRRITLRHQDQGERIHVTLDGKSFYDVDVPAVLRDRHAIERAARVGGDPERLHPIPGVPPPTYFPTFER